LPESAFLRANGLSLHYLDWGGPRRTQGPTALLLHATGFLAAVWWPIAEALSQRYRVLALDQRGHGDSDKPPRGYHRLDLVADLRAFLDALELKGIIGIGHSAGAANIACCEALRPGSFRRAVLIEPIVFPPSIREIAGERMSRLPRGALRRRTVWPTREALLKSYRSRPPFKTWREDVLRLYVEHGTHLREDGQVELKCPGPIEAQMYAGATPFDAFELLPDVACPALVVRGEHSDSHLPFIAQAIADQMPDAGVVTIEGAGHFCPMENPDAVLAEITRFLDESDG
jgi:pimeloyl-ACP methyl ester carboxylesterase